MNSLKDYIAMFFKLLNIESDNKKIHFYKEYISSAIMEFFDDESIQEAYDVYSFFLDIYRFNISGEQSFIDLLDILRKYEENAAVLSDKQRDHYIHSVNVFLLGLAIYSQNANFRQIFDLYLNDEDRNIKHFDTNHEEFFFRWGIAALFHDSGYPIEIINNQFSKFISFVAGKDEKGKPTAKPYLSYFDFEKINSIENLNLNRFVLPQYIMKAIEQNNISINKMTDYIALNISYTLNISYDDTREKMGSFLTTMQNHQFVDHGFYSALIVMKWFGELMQKRPRPTCLCFSHILDSASGIFLHNAYCNIFTKEPISLPPLNPQKHPIGFLLMLCDEIQEWNRPAYGIETRKMTGIDDSNITIDDRVLKLHYITKQGVVKDDFIEGKTDMLNSLLDVSCIFENGISITATTLTEQYIFSLASQRDDLVPRVLIEHIELIAESIHNKYNDKQLERYPDKPLEYPSWESLPDTLKYSNVRQARDIALKLREIDCYIAEYSNDIHVKDFTSDEIDLMASIEHDLWVKERVTNGWVYGENKSIKQKKSPYIKPYEELSEDIKELDRNTIRNIIPLLEEVDLNVYRETKRGIT